MSNTHARELPAELEMVTRSLLAEVHRQTHAEVLSLAIAKTPVASGRMRAAWQSMPASIEAAVARLQPTEVRNQVPYAAIINRGRRMGKNAFNVRTGEGTTLVATNRRRKDGSVVMRRRSSFRVAKPRMLGSEEAPYGIKGPVLRELAAREDAIFERAAAVVEARSPR